MFKHIVVSLENGNKIEITAPQNNAENRYVQWIKMNNKTYRKNYFNYDDLQKGVNIFFEMNDSSNKKKRGTKEADFPYLFSNEIK